MSVQEEILNEIKAYETIIIHRHQNPDPDAIGSQVGLAELLRTSFPNKKIYAVGGPINDLGYLAEMDEIPDEIYKGALVIATDTADTPRISDQRYSLGEKLIKIDHHPNDDAYGDLLFVNTKASSCSEIIADFWQWFPEDLTMSSAAARLLYAGIVGDTGRFLYDATSPHTLEISAQLMRYDFDAAELSRQIEEVTRDVARLSGYVNENLEIAENGAAQVVIAKELLEEYHLTVADTSGIVSVPGKIGDVKAWVLFVQNPEGTYRVHLRSKGPIINEIAKAHHGGGHPLASGANAKDKAECDAIYEELKVACE